MSETYIQFWSSKTIRALPPLFPSCRNLERAGIGRGGKDIVDIVGRQVKVFNFDKAFQRPYRYFAIALKVILSLSDRYKFSPMIDYRLKFVKM